MNKALAMALFILVIAASCKTKKTTIPSNQPVTNEKANTDALRLLNQINTNSNQFQYYQAKAKVNYREGSQNLDLTVSLIMEKNKHIWMSVTALLGIEVARIMITQDSVQILDRLHRKCIKTDIGYLQKMSNVPLKLINLQNLITGNTVFDNTINTSSIDTVMGVLLVNTTIGLQRQRTFYNSAFKTQRSIIADSANQREMKIVYKSAQNFGLNAYPSNMDINIRAEKNIDCTIELSNFVFEKKKDVQFNVPSGYEIIKP